MILAIGAHPDDAEMGVGGILLAHRAKGHGVAVLTLSSGSAAGANVTITACEVEREARRIGAQSMLADLPDNRIPAARLAIDVTEQVIKQAIALFRPAVVYTHSLHDMDKDHRVVHQATIIAARQVPRVACYQSPSATADFRPNRFIPIDDYIEEKLAIVAGHESQIAPDDYLPSGLLGAMARYWSRYSGSRAAEALEMV